MKKLTIIFLFLLAGALPLSSQEMPGGESPGFFGRIRFSCEWGYLQSLYTDWHYNILSEEGYRINERSYGLDPHPNGLLLIGAGFVTPGDLMMISLHGGYSGIYQPDNPGAAALQLLPENRVGRRNLLLRPGRRGLPYPQDIQDKGQHHRRARSRLPLRIHAPVQPGPDAERERSQKQAAHTQSGRARICRRKKYPEQQRRISGSGSYNLCQYLTGRFRTGCPPPR